MKTILMIGVRRPCYQAARRLGHRVVLWGDGPLHESRKKSVDGVIEYPYSACEAHLPEELLAEIRKYPIDVVIANTEEAVVIGARVRRALGFPSLAVDVVERFHNKYLMKSCAREMGIPMTEFALIDPNSTSDGLIEQLGLPLIIKPVDDSGARHVVLAKTTEEVSLSLVPGMLAERFIEGTELSVETMIDGGRPIFHNITEYLHQWKKSVAPGGYSPSLRDKIIKLNDQIIEGFGVDRGMTHAEFYLTPKGILFGEVAIRPPGGYYMNLIQNSYGFDPWEAYVQLSCRKKILPLPERPTCATGVYTIYPKSGRVSAISGIEEASRLPGVIDSKFRLQVGDWVEEHQATSNEKGHFIIEGIDRDVMVEVFDQIESMVHIEVENPSK